MRALLLSIHTICSVFLLVVVLLQPSKSGGLSGMFGGGGTSFFGGRGAAPFLTKITVVLATIFIVTSVILTSISSITA
ncbi:preprotein translocase subunit SecG, partial [candidate division WOR-3 bacterium]|nr:preprotein translocase subunit SecG [candidate division WOR-3 bacterium]